MFKVPFANKESYLLWKNDWRAKYKENSLKIKDLKKEIKEIQLTMVMLV